MALKLYGWFSSAPALAVALFLHEKNVPFEWIEVDLAKGEHKTSDFIAKHPFRQVPCIDNDGFVLFESRAIARYLDERYPDQGMQFFPKDLHKRALVDQATWAETFHFGRFATALVFETLNKKYFGLETDANTVAESKSRLYTRLDAYETILSKQKYIAGNEFSIANLVHIPGAGWLLEEVNLDLGEGRPNVQRWLSELVARESWQKTKAILNGHT